MTKKNLGQYFTISDELQQFVFDAVKNKLECLLEPSFGAAHLLRKFKEHDPNYPMICYEIDSSIKPIIDINENQVLTYADFTKQQISRKFKTIIGNPPYVKQSRGINLYIKFIELCYDLLDENGGEMVFIVPSDFLKLTSSASIISKMTSNGSFTNFLFPHNEKLFEGASIDIVVFRYQRDGVPQQRLTIVNGVEKYCSVNKGIITFADKGDENNKTAIESMFNVYVGLVSGRDEIYRVPFGNIDVLCDKGRVEKFIFAESFPTDNAQINAHLEDNKVALLGRKIRKFGEHNWYEWGAPRNISSIRKYWGRPCIYIRTMTRHKDVAFVGKVQYFGGTLLCLVPKAANIEDSDIEKIVQYFNSDAFKKDYIYAGRFKIGHKQISNAFINALV